MRAGLLFAFPCRMTTNINDLAPPAWAAAGILPEQGVRLSEVVSALSYALDITEGQAEGHAVRSCVIGMRIGQILGLGEAERSDLFYALLLKDLGCSSNAARLCNLFGADDLRLKQAHKLNDWTDPKASASYAMSHLPGGHAIAKAWQVLVLAVKGRGSGREMVETRCERGADIARMLDLSTATQAAIRSLDEHWDGQGLPMGISGDGIPLLARICCLAQTVEVFLSAHGQPAAYEMARSRSGTWFDPALVDALESFEFDADFWASLRQEDPRALVAALEPKDRIIVADSTRIDSVAEAFARVIDAKSPYTGQHSSGVARIAIGMAAHVGLPREERTLLRRAALLHDIGKLGVSNLILDKPGKLTQAEMALMRQHPRFTDRSWDGCGPSATWRQWRRGTMNGWMGGDITAACRRKSWGGWTGCWRWPTSARRCRRAGPIVRRCRRRKCGGSSARRRAGRCVPEAIEALEGVGIRHDERPIPY